jgi:putative nucleotidyltransferase with HDIG domain
LAVVTEADVTQAFPELSLIKNATLRTQVAGVWHEAARKGGWKKISDAPFTLLFKGSGLLVDHTRRITRLAWAVAGARDDHLDTDVLIAGALLHDVGKLLEYELAGGTVRKSAYGETVRHPAAGADLAKSKGLPEAVVHIIASHSHEGDTMDRTPEAIIVHHCDFIDFEIKKRGTRP